MEIVPVHPAMSSGAPPPRGADATAEGAAQDRTQRNAPPHEGDGERRSPSGPERLTPAEERMVQALRQRDQVVRTHEQAHMAAGGGLVTGGATYSYQKGPDGQRYAVGGEVSIDTSRPADPEAAIRKARKIARAALAPAEPSGQDYRVAARARLMEAEARRELQAVQGGTMGDRDRERVGTGDREGPGGADAPGRAMRERLERHFAQVDRPEPDARFRARA
ncbi:MAG: putative metalloprotease CJM1_0395 family protein [Ectothiorhodospira sp.]